MPKTPKDFSKAVVYKLCCKDVEITEIYVGSTTNFTQRKKQHKSDCNNVDSRDYNLYVYQFIRENGGWENWEMVLIEKYPCNDVLELERRERYYIEQLKASLNKYIPTRTPKEYREANRDTIREKNIKYREANRERLREKKKEYYEANRERIIEKSKEYREANRDKIREKKKEYREANKDKIREKSKEWGEKNKDKIRQKKKEWGEKNKNKIREKNKAYYEKNKEKHNKYTKVHYEKNKDKIREKCKAYYENNKNKILEKHKEKHQCECGVVVSRGSLSTHKKSNKHKLWLDENQS